MLLAFLRSILQTKQQQEDAQRKEFILNVLLIGSLVIFAFGSFVNVSNFLIASPGEYVRASFFAIFFGVICLFFAGLFVLSRKGYFQVSAYIVVGVFFSFAVFMGYHFGMDVSVSLLTYVLVIVMAGILINTRFAFITTALAVVMLLVLGELQSSNIIIADQDWRTQPWYRVDTLMTGIIFLVIATVSWLSNREIERSLARAHRSEAMLRKERDSLEVIVEERTRELKEAQLEKISQLYSFAEFGRLSSGLFHDLMNPLTAVSLNVERAKSQDEGLRDISRMQQYLDKAFVAAKRMERFIAAIRTQIGKHGEKKLFSLSDEIQQVLDILSYKAHVAGVQLEFYTDTKGVLMGDEVRFSQVMLNLVTNAIDAYGHIDTESIDAKVVVRIKEEDDKFVCSVHDTGSGISEHDIKNIFTAFFSTKTGSVTKGTGVGLSIVKTIIEKDFNGTVAVISTPSKGTTFTVTLSK